MKICVIGTRGFPNIQGGVEKHCEALYPLLAKDNEIIVFRRMPYVKDKVSSNQFINIRFIDLPSTKIKGLEAVLHSFIATVYTVFIRPDVVHIHNIGPSMFTPLLKIFGIKMVLTYHSPNYEHEKWGWFSRHLLLACEKIALTCADSIIFVNKFQMEKYSEKIKQKSYYVPNGIPVKKTRTLNCEYLQSLGVVPGKYIISVGRITPEKGFEYLIKSYKQSGIPEKLVIAGGVEAESSYGEELKNLAQGSDVVFAGFVQGEKLEQLYRNARLYVLSSVNEGFPLVLLEAMSFGLDVLVSDIPATHLVDLEKGDYFEKANISDLTRKLQNKLFQVQIKRHYDLGDFDWQKIANQVNGIYRS